MSKLTNNTMSLQNILDAVNNLPNAGSGESVNTCTLTVNKLYPRPIVPGAITSNGSAHPDYVPNIVATVYENGEITTKMYVAANGGSTNIEIPNVVCGSVFSIICGGTLNNAEVISCTSSKCDAIQKTTSPEMDTYPSTFQVIAEPGGVCSITFDYA